MSAQDRFQHALVTAQGLSVTPDKMPYLCVVGAFDFDELRAECLQLYRYMDYRQRVDARLAEWDPCKSFINGTTFEQFRERVEQEEFSTECVATHIPQTPIEAEAETFLALDPKQRASLTENLEYCGCKCFRSLDQPRGFWFA